MDFTLVGLWHEMGFMARAVVVVLLAMSAYSLSISVERLVAYRKGRALSRLYIEALAPMVENDGAAVRGRRPPQEVRGRARRDRRGRRRRRVRQEPGGGRARRHRRSTSPRRSTARWSA